MGPRTSQSSGERTLLTTPSVSTKMAACRAREATQASAVGPFTKAAVADTSAQVSSGPTTLAERSPVAGRRSPSR